jgi:hypothetical protein
VNIKLESFGLVIADCNKALEIDSNNQKVSNLTVFDSANKLRQSTAAP